MSILICPHCGFSYDTDTNVEHEDDCICKQDVPPPESEQSIYQVQEESPY